MLHTNHLFFAYLTIVHSLRGDREHAAEQLIQDGVPAQLDVGRNRHARRDMEIPSRRPTPSIAVRGRTARCCSAALNPWARVCVDHLLAVGFARGAPRPGRRRPGRLLTSVAGDGVAPNAVHPPMEETIRREIERFDLDLRVLLGEDKQT
jgi:hypothetical protein